jgi:hypothetical protein
VRQSVLGHDEVVAGAVPMAQLACCEGLLFSELSRSRGGPARPMPVLARHVGVAGVAVISIIVHILNTQME